jgi:hypothetical protein
MPRPSHPSWLHVVIGTALSEQFRTRLWFNFIIISHVYVQLFIIITYSN